jgi:heme/copper-type cytochrome/quinol oxidase subunit 4
VWVGVRAFASRVKGYVSGNWGAPFVVGFMALLVVAAFSLALGFSVLADEVAVWAYYALVVGVVLQLVCFLKCRGGEGESGE